MRFKPMGILTSAVIFATLVPVHADEGSNNNGKFFAKLYGGVTMLGDQDISQNGVAGTGATSDASFDNGWTAGASAGYYFTNNIATEIAWDYRTNPNDTVNFTDGTSFNDGDFSSNIFFLNSYYHFNPIMNSKFRPYLGVGLGFVEEIDIDLETAGTEASYSGDGELAYQFIAGTSYGLNNNWDLTADLRYMLVDGGMNLKNKNGAGELSGVNYNPISLTLGAAYKF